MDKTSFLNEFPSHPRNFPPSKVSDVLSMNFPHFLVIFPQQCCFHFNRPNAPKYTKTEKTRRDRVFIAKQFSLYAKLSAETRSEDGIAIRIYVFPMIITV